MEVLIAPMGPERILPSSEDELGEEERPSEGGMLPVGGAVWSGGEVGGDMEGEEEEEGEGEANSGGYYYQPLNQEPGEGEGGEEEARGEEEEEEEEKEARGEEEEKEEEEEARGVDRREGGVGESSHAEQLQEVQQRIEVMGLHLPEAPPPDSDEEEGEESEAQRSQASIPMDADHVALVKRTMAAVALPSLVVPAWAEQMSEEQWNAVVQRTLQSRHSTAALKRPRRGNLP